MSWPRRTRIRIVGLLGVVAIAGVASAIVTSPRDRFVLTDAPWALLGTTQDGSGMVIDTGEWGGCGTGPNTVQIRETARSVTVRVVRRERVPDSDHEACALVGHRTTPYVARLHAPVRGRAITGPLRRRGVQKAIAATTSGGRTDFAMPRVIGLRVSDATTAIQAWGFKSTTSARGQNDDQVLRQTPRAGSAIALYRRAHVQDDSLLSTVRLNSSD